MLEGVGRRGEGWRCVGDLAPLIRGLLEGLGGVEFGHIVSRWTDYLEASWPWFLFEDVGIG